MLHLQCENISIFNPFIMDSAVVSPFDSQKLLSILQQVNKSNIENDMQRLTLVDALHEALARLETPWETAFRIICTQVSKDRADYKSDH